MALTSVEVEAAHRLEVVAAGTDPAVIGVEATANRAVTEEATRAVDGATEEVSEGTGAGPTKGSTTAT